MGETSKFERNMFGIRLFVMPRAYMYNVSNSRTTASVALIPERCPYRVTRSTLRPKEHQRDRATV